jgi:hypothetical protein
MMVAQSHHVGLITAYPHYVHAQEVMQELDLSK